jgi:hypothetical protein
MIAGVRWMNSRVSETVNKSQTIQTGWGVSKESFGWLKRYALCALRSAFLSLGGSDLGRVMAKVLPWFRQLVTVISP